MSFHVDLLKQARHLANREPKRPSQASLRRAISAAYYALFHLLISEASRLFARGDERLWKRIARAYSHSEMMKISMSFAHGEMPKSFDKMCTVPLEVQSVADAFVALQQARHDADYDLLRTFTRGEALNYIQQVESAFADWDSIRRHDIARIYLGCFLVWKDWDKTR